MFVIDQFSLQNANAYLLFYRKRTTQPLGGTTAQKIEQARLQPSSLSPKFEPVSIDTQLPTPPDEATSLDEGTNHAAKFKDREVYGPARPPHGEDWSLPRSHDASNGGSMGSSPPQLDDIELSNFETLPPFAHMAALNEFLMAPQFTFPDPSSKASPTSSNEAEPDLDEDQPEDAEDTWRGNRTRLYQHSIHDTPFHDTFPNAIPWNSPQSPHGSTTSDPNPFTDATEETENAGGDDNTAPVNDHLARRTPSP